MTTFESVQALWERPYKTWQPSLDKESQDDYENPFNRSSGEVDQGGLHEEAEIDENILNSQVWDAHEDEVDWHKSRNDGIGG
jgi:DNA polymerase zeta